MNGVIVTLNAGSSSVKAAAFASTPAGLEETPLLRGEISGLDSAPVLSLRVGDGPKSETQHNDMAGDHAAAIAALLDAVRSHTPENVAAVGHRIVHGGAPYSTPQVLTPEIVAALARLTPLAPGHQPHNLAGVDAARRAWPDALQIGCFDTAFHRTQPAVAERFALPRDLVDEEGLIRYGFHGLSYDYIASAAPKVMGAPARRVIVAHLGAGASMCALLDGKSVATTMGFSALDGLPMATRCGAIDPGVLLYLLQEKGMEPDALSQLLYARSGLLGLSGLSGDMRVLEASDESAAHEAIDYFVYRCVREIGALAACLGGVDALVFTAGVGENSALIRKRILAGSAWLGFEIDDEANKAHRAQITRPGGAPSVWVIPTNEELVIARQTRMLAGA